MRELPKVRYEGQLWFLDARLRQIRAVSDPNTFQNLDDFEVAYFEDLLSKDRTGKTLAE